MRAGRPFLAAALAAASLLWATATPQLAAQDQEESLRAIVRVHATVPAEATTARALGTEREGNGILIDSNGLILTIGYLILEADSIEVRTASGTIPADLVGYDGDTGFGLIRVRSLIRATPMQLGESSRVEVGDSLQVGGFDDVQPVRVISRDEFVGYWEYLLDNAVYTAPAFPDFGGAALIRDGKLVGVGSIVAAFELSGFGRVACNMFVPIDLLKPILQELIRSGRSGLPPRPWLGLNTEEAEGRVVVTMVTPGGPADQAGLKRGDIILAVGQEQVVGRAELYRRVWSTGAAGVVVHLRVVQGDTVRDLTVQSVDRNERLKRPHAAPGGASSGPAALLGPSLDRQESAEEL